MQITFVENTEIMSKSKAYKKQEPAKQVAGEPMMEYSSVAMSDFVSSIPIDALSQAIDFAIEEHRRGGCIPHDQVDSIVKERMGWK